MNTTTKAIVISSVASVAASLCSIAQGQTPPPVDTPASVTVNIDASTPLSRMNPRDLGSSNVALWNNAATFASPLVRQWISEMRPGMIRIPGGSWTNCVYWNGNGVRGADGKVNPTKIGADGYPAVDYSGYAPSFTVDSKTLHPSGAGNVDVKTVQEFIDALTTDVRAMPCLNAGTGRAVDAAEWVKWAKRNNYKTGYWEVGNELGGSWEPGDQLPFGKGKLTAEMYTQRYNAIASAMKAVDPTIQVGSCPYVGEALRDCGTNVDFVSIHTYPGSSTQTDEQGFADVPKIVAREVGHVRESIQKYQPNRADKIKICYSEWNTSGGITASEMYSGLWAAMMLSEMAHNKVDFATQWDCFTHTYPMKDGHALIYEHSGQFFRKAEYYALWLWNNYNGEQVLPVSSSGDQTVYSFASRSDDALYVMLINKSRDRQSDVAVNLSGFTPAAAGESATLSSREYFWNPITHYPGWSTGIRVEKLATGTSFTASLAPFSITSIRIPSQAKPELSSLAQAALAEAATPVQGKPELSFVMANEVYVGDKLEGLVTATESGSPSRPYPKPLPPAKLSADGTANFDRASVRLGEALGRFVIQPTTPGSLTLSATVEGATATKQVTVKPSIPRPMLLWDFTTPPVTDSKTFQSEFRLSEDFSMRANRAVARVDLEAVLPSEKKSQRALLIVKNFPGEQKLNRSNIRGVFFDAMAQSIQCDDPNAAVQIVMQSPANWWMVLGSVPLKDLKTWKSSRIPLTDEKHIKAISSAFNIWFVISANKPVTGSIFLDRIGLMVR